MKDHQGTIVTLHHTQGTQPDFKIWVADYQYPYYWQTYVAPLKPRFIPVGKPVICKRSEAAAHADVEVSWKGRMQMEIRRQQGDVESKY